MCVCMNVVRRVMFLFWFLCWCFGCYWLGYCSDPFFFIDDLVNGSRMGEIESSLYFIVCSFRFEYLPSLYNARSPYLVLKVTTEYLVDVDLIV